jgi:hypothetical protein
MKVKVMMKKKWVLTPSPVNAPAQNQNEIRRKRRNINETSLRNGIVIRRKNVVKRELMSRQRKEEGVIHQLLIEGIQAKITEKISLVGLIPQYTRMAVKGHQLLHGGVGLNQVQILRRALRSPHGEEDENRGRYRVRLRTLVFRVKQQCSPGEVKYRE